MLPAAPAFAATINVDSGCTLAQAVASANDDSAPDGSTCEAGSETDTIELSANVTLADDLPDITTSMTIDGNGYTITGGGANTNFRLVSVSGGTVTFDNMTVTQFRVTGNGGALYISGDSTVVNIRNSTFSRNYASTDGGAIVVAGGTLHSSNNLYHNNASTDDGGAIFLDSGVSGTSHTITGDTFTENRAPYGGALRIEHATTIEYSRFVGNHAGTSGMAISSNTAGVIIRNSTFSKNTGSDSAYLINVSLWAGGGTVLTLEHVTIKDHFRDGDLNLPSALKLESAQNASVHIRNSILFGVCGLSLRVSITASGSLADHGDCVNEESTHTSIITESDLAAFVPISGGSGGYYPLTQNSAALGAGDSAHCLTKDQRNDATYARDSASCNIGAINEIYVPPAPPAQAGGQAGEWSPTAAPSQPRATPTLPPNFRISGSGRATTNYTVLDGRGIGIASLAANYIAALDIWGWLGAGVEVCIAGSGSLMFLDAADAPRVPRPVANAYSDGGFTCMQTKRAGSLVLAPGPAAPARTPALSAQALSGCMVRADYILNLRAAPGGEIIGAVRYGATLTALSRTSGWYQVDANGVTGWLSADYVTPIGSCG